MYHSFIIMEKCDPETYMEVKLLLTAAGHDDWSGKKHKWDELNKNKRKNDRVTKRPVKYAEDASGLIHLFRNTWEHPARKYLEEFLAIVLNEDKNSLANLQRALQIKGYLPQHALGM